ncbi:MAG: ATP synthase F1 subunit delta [Ardenticatenaceae bacterium]|nr:ATP synthase F1 subunit delta [Ardenticatenaceae bacterium]HBY97643.1 ATP synthase F1 subunit delta [Chloroflexota bacterium]
MSTPGIRSNYARAIVKDALGPWLENLRTAQRSLRDGVTGDALADPTKLALALPATLRPEVRRFLQLLAREDDLDRLPEIIRELESLYAEGGETLTATITTAIEMTPPEREALEARLRQRFGQGLLFDYEVAPSLLGGVRVRIGDLVIDGSVAGRLEAMRERIVGA